MIQCKLKEKSSKGEKQILAMEFLVIIIIILNITINAKKSQVNKKEDY
jgi:hypothetical protein